MHSHYVPLHLHTQYSLLDGAVRIDDLIEKAHKYKVPALAITDHGNLFGAIDFYKKVKKAEIKPIIGCEIYLTSGSISENNKNEKRFHLILLCCNIHGYRNLTAIVGKSYTEGFYYKPRVDKDLLRQYSGGLIALSACMKGEVPYYLAQNDINRAREAALEYKHIFGVENFFLEIQANELPDQEELNRKLIELSKDLHIGLVATNDTHYLEREDAKAHEILLCIQTGKTIHDPDRFKFKGSGMYFKSPEEMKNHFSHVPEAVENTYQIAQRCALDITFGEFHLPQYRVPEGYTFKSYLRMLTEEALRIRVGHSPDNMYLERLDKELGIIDSMGFNGYFLVVWDFINYSKNKGIPVGPGRGSAAGSLVAYCLGITDIDPIQYNLLFERFLNPERVSMPDIDVDFCKDRRGEVIEYVSDFYGKDHVAQIITFGTMQARAVIRDVGRALGIAYQEVDKVAKLIPAVLGIKLKDALKTEEKLKELYESNNAIHQLIDISLKLEGLTRHASTHAAGIVISAEPLNDIVPLYRSPNDNSISTQYSMEAVEALGLLKFDFLGLKTLTVISKTEKLINETRKKAMTDDEHTPFSVENVPLDDKKTYKLLSQGKTTGVFQLESSGMKEILVRMKPSVFEDLIALVALYRPGPLGSGMVDQFIDRKKGKAQITYEHPLLKDILKETYGIILYQEQVMQIANKLANFTMGQADILRKAMGKKKVDVMETSKNEFIEGAKNNNISEEIARKIFDLMAYFAGYGFNKSHSAAYALISYQTAFLKAHYPVEFMAATLSSDMDNTDKVIKFISECRDFGIAIFPPDINESDREFKVISSAIRFGLKAVKGVGSTAIDSILEARREGPFQSILDFLKRVDTRRVNKRVLESLIKAGAMSSFGSRSQLIQVLDTALEEVVKIQKKKESGQFSFFDIASGAEKESHTIKLPDVKEWSDDDILKMEKASLGFYISGHPLNRYKKEFKRLSLTNLENLPEKLDKSTVTICGIIQSIKRIQSKKTGEYMAYVTVEDQYGTIEITCFPKLYKTASDLIIQDQPLIVKGIVEKIENGVKVLADSIFSFEQVREDPTSFRESQSQTVRPYPNNGRGFQNGRKAAYQKLPEPAYFKRVELIINSTQIKIEDIGKLKSIIKKYEGNCPLLLRITLPNNWETTISTSFKTSPNSEMKMEIEQLLGQGSISYT
jgi:DNA polymerase-3 subunit alpha